MSPRVRSYCGLALLVALPLSCSSDDDGRSPPASAGARNGGQAGSTGVAGASGQAGHDGEPSGGAAPSDGGASGAGASNVGHLGGASLDTAGAPPALPTECERAAAWGEPSPLGVVSSPSADERLLAMTHDQLTVVFTRDDVLMVADRASDDASFGTPLSVVLPAGYDQTRGVALHPDGLGLLVVSELGDTFADVLRAARGETFGAIASSERFAELAQHLYFTSGELWNPVLSSDGESLFYTLLKAGASRMYRVEGSSQFSVPGGPLDVITLGGAEPELKLTQSVSADGRTLFFFDEARAHSVGAWNEAPGAPFTKLTDFSAMQSVFTGTGCGRLYGTRMLEASLDVVVRTLD